jgi:F-type H+-transporting ATPase subunit b
MRMRTLIASAVLAVGVVVALPAMASTASAATIPYPKDATALQKCVVDAVNQGTDVSECYKAPSPIVPDATDLFYGGLAFLILLVAMWKFALPAITAGLNGRSERISADLSKADSARRESEDLLATYQQQLADSKAEATRIIEDARATAEGLKADMARRAEAEIAEMRERSARDVEASKAQAIADLTGEVATLAIGAAEVVVQRNLDRDTQVALIENYINQVGSAN